MLLKKIKVIFNHNSKIGRLFDNFLAILTLVSILSLILETMPNLSKFSNQFIFIERFSVAFFSFEYIGRIFISKPVSRYIFSWLGIIDLLAILPSLLNLGNFTFLKSGRVLRIIRLLRLLRLAKISRLKTNNTSVLTLDLFIYFSLLLSASLLIGTLLYLLEPNSSFSNSIPEAMVWSFKVFMAGFSVPIPETALGQGLHIIARFIGLLLFGLAIKVTGNIFDYFLGRK